MTLRRIIEVVQPTHPRAATTRLVHILFELLLAFVCEKHAIHFHEDLLKCLFVVAGLVCGIFDQTLLEMHLGEFCDLWAAVTVKHAEKRVAVTKIHLCDVCVLHVAAPALHLCTTEANERRFSLVIYFFLNGLIDQAGHLWTHFKC